MERSVHHRRVRRRKWYQRLPPWVREYAVEIGLVVAVLIAIFLLVEPWDIRETLFRWARQSWRAFSGFLDAVVSALIAGVGSLTLSDATAVGILLVVVFVAIWRLRWRIIQSERLWSTACPQCGLPELHRIHRRLGGRMLGVLGFPVGRYHCRHCGWKGLRIRKTRTVPSSLPQPLADQSLRFDQRPAAATGPSLEGEAASQQQSQTQRPAPGCEKG
jgi:predicted RNA-binding Zn-ribbon protein involved in translation (DUF1610 family)